MSGPHRLAQEEKGIQTENKIVIELRNGQQFEALTSQVFVPTAKDLVVLLADTREERVFALDTVSCLMISGPLLPKLHPHKTDPVEIVECVTGRVFKVRSLKAHQLQEGFFAIPIKKNSSFQLIFFTEGGVRSRVKHTLLGQIVEKQGMISQDDLEKVLDDQQHLKNLRLGEILSQEHKLEQEVIEEVINLARNEDKSGKGRRIGDMLVGELLVSAGLVTRNELETSLATQGLGKKKRIGSLLVEQGLVSEEQILAALATKFNLPFIDLDKHEVDQQALTAISADLAARLQVFPVADKNEYLQVATCQPTDYTISDSLRFHTNRQIQLVIASPEQIKDHIAKHYFIATDKQKDLFDDLGADEIDWTEDEDDLVSESDSETIRLSNRILIDAYQQQASDIHLEPGAPRQPLGVRYRIDGICQTIQMLPARFGRPLIARIKILANLDITEHRKTQTGKIVIRYQGKKIEYRVEITPTVGGQEDAVLRILSGSAAIPLDEMGMSEINLASLKNILVKPYGIILCVGPTGSGKTTTLHAALGYINQPERKIWTVEDPVEITQPGLRQVEVRPQIGLTFQVALRSLLRADPDVVMIGEMRDRDAAHTAIEAALTGHLVLSTLHTNNAPETVTRLIEMGEDPFNLADALLGIIAQRLARKLCPFCKQACQPSKKEYGELIDFYGEELFKEHGYPEYDKNITVMRKSGCKKCGGSGYKGRVAIHELLISSIVFKQTIKQKSSIADIHKVAIDNGMRTLRMDGVDKVLQGITDLGQIKKVCL